MHALLLALSLSLSAQAGWQNKVKKLSDVEFDHYYALRAYMNEDQKKAYLKLKTEEERNQLLVDLGLWDRFYKYDEGTRALIIAGKVEVGWTKDMLEMAWGTPFDKRRLAGRAASRSELWVYRFEQTKDGGILVWEPGSKTQYTATRLFERELTLDDDRIVLMEEHTAAF